MCIQGAGIFKSFLLRQGLPEFMHSEQWPKTTHILTKNGSQRSVIQWAGGGKISDGLRPEKREGKSLCCGLSKPCSIQNEILNV